MYRVVAANYLLDIGFASVVISRQVKDRSEVVEVAPLDYYFVLSLSFPVILVPRQVFVPRVTTRRDRTTAVDQNRIQLRADAGTNKHREPRSLGGVLVSRLPYAPITPSVQLRVLIRP